MSRAIDSSKYRQQAAFTIVEMLISCVVISIIGVVMVGLADSVRFINNQATAKSQASREAQRAMETIAAALSQATLNTYLDYVDASGKYRFSASANSSTFVPDRYVRTSELRFSSGNDLAGIAPVRPTHSLFFQAPLGMASSKYQGLENLLNSIGFYVEFRDDSDSRPDYFSLLPNPPRVKWRYRLVQAIQPSDRLTIYQSTAADPGLKSSDPNGLKWQTDTLDATTGSVIHAIADNIIAMVILPGLGAADGYADNALAPNYRYDSTATNSDPALNSRNQLPPVLKVTLVTVDEKSFARFQGDSITPKDLGLEGLFRTVGSLTDASQPGFAKDIATLKATLTRNKIEFRIATLTIAINSARWSRGERD